MASDEQLKFQLALVFYRTERHNINLPYEIKTKCSALWKQATVGKCSDSKEQPPGFFDYVGKHRWYVQLDVVYVVLLVCMCSCGIGDDD